MFCFLHLKQKGKSEISKAPSPSKRTGRFFLNVFLQNTGHGMSRKKKRALFRVMLQARIQKRTVDIVVLSML